MFLLLMVALPADIPRTRTVRGKIVLADDGSPAFGVRVIALDGQGTHGVVVEGEGISAADGTVVRIEKDGTVIDGEFDCSKVTSIEGIHVAGDVRRPNGT